MRAVKSKSNDSPSGEQKLLWPRRPVLKLLLRASILAAPFLLFLAAFELKFIQLNPSLVGAKKILLERQARQTEVLVLGSSHEATGIDPTALGGAGFNLAGQSQSLYYDIGLLEKYRPILTSLKLVVLPISYFSLEYELEDAPEHWRTYHYKYFHDLPHQDWHKSISMRNLSAYFLADERTRALVVLGTCSNAGREYDPWGGWTNRPWSVNKPAMSSTGSNSLYRSAIDTVKIHHSMMKSGNLPANVNRLETAIQELKRDGIGVVMVTLPVSQYYGERVQREAYDRMQKTVEELTRKCQVPYRNYMYDERFDDSDFTNSDHLNFLGAQKFTRLFREEVLNPCFRQKLSNVSARPEPNITQPELSH